MLWKAFLVPGTTQVGRTLHPAAQQAFKNTPRIDAPMEAIPATVKGECCEQQGRAWIKTANNKNIDKDRYWVTVKSDGRLIARPNCKTCGGECARTGSQKQDPKLFPKNTRNCTGFHVYEEPIP